MKKIREYFLSKKNLKRDIAIMFLFFLASACVVKAGNLDSPGSPGATSYTLSDIYTRLTTNATAVEGNHSFSPSADPASSFYTLKQIYDAIPTIDPALVKLNQSYLGVSGTLTPDGGTANPSEVLDGETFFGDSQTDWVLQTGTMTNVGQQNITPGTASQAITEGYHDGTGAVSGDADLVSGNIKSGANIFGVNGDSNVVDTTSGNVAISDICSGKIAWADGSAVTGTLNPTAASIGVGNSVCGVAGTLLKNEYNGSAGTSVADYAFYPLTTSVPGFLGGVDDYNAGQTSGGYGVMPTGSYSTAWTICDSGDYCGTNDATYADHKDNSTGLVWSKWLDSGTTHTWFWANNCYEPGTAQNPGTCAANGADACKCVKKPEGSKVGCESIGDGNWRTPTQKELMQAYINGSWGNLTSASDYYWSATTFSTGTQFGWYSYLRHGVTNTTTKTLAGSVRVRCVR